MRTIRRNHPGPVQELAATHAVVETDDHEQIDIDGCSPDEVEAKLHDFYAWAS